MNGQNKAEILHQREPWRTLEDVEYATLEFKNCRLLGSIGDIPPVELEPQAVGAVKTGLRVNGE